MNHAYREYIKPFLHQPFHGEMGGIEVWLYHHTVREGTLKRRVIKDIVFEDIEEGDTSLGYKCPLIIHDEEAQFLADQLWDLGYRPKGAKGSRGQLEAVNNHLQDMKKIAFKKLGIDG